MRKLRNLKKRAHGLPKSGPFTVVVTDIQGWTALCAEHPELSIKVLSIHNSIIRKASWMNFGSTHETEGDSFTIVFYDAKDAAAFCLQAQHMLHMQQWPSPQPQPDLPTARHVRSSSHDRISHSKLLTAPNSLNNSQPLPDLSFARHMRSTSNDIISANQPQTAPNSPENSQPLPDLPDLSIARHMGNNDDTNSPAMKVYDNPLSKLSMIMEDVSKIASYARSSQQKLLMPLQQNCEQGRGLNICVRMGMASGVLQPGRRLHGHPTIEKAKEVSDTAAGGQILMDGSTYAEIKDDLGELGTVDTEGVHPDKVRWKRVATWSAWFLCWFFNPPGWEDERAVALD
ncbi:nucleotide cyclase, partial [Dunaliella salina]